MPEFGRRWRGLAAALIVPPLLTVFLTAYTEQLGLSNQVLIYLVALVAVSLLCGMVPALVAAVWTTVLLDYYFISPVHAFRIAVASDVITLSAFVIVAVTVASVVEYSGKQFLRATQAAAEAQQLEAVDRMRTALLTAVSHDLRAPLAAARASVDTLRDPRFELSETDRGDLLGAADSSLGRLSRLVEDLLDMSRLQTGALQPRLEPVAAGEVIPRAVDDVPAAEGRITVAPIPAAVPPALADGALLERVLANLVGNAAKHTTSGIEVTAVLSTGLTGGLSTGLSADPTESAGGNTAGERGARVEIRVIDHGPGIPAADRDRVFRPFQRLGDRDNTAGVGLGLALARGLTEAMGGELWPEDTPGGGLTMVVAIPARSRAGTVKGAAR
ncbi:PAS domain-containing sensor histidine kinase [Catenulispora sp. NF23]|uniref:histidine kinase n=1 Tax=Catenulispora pinistramenti TaxID=2705254 RepID=A0ABS5L2D1_9ACTN|nr:ATP-binding protein [Catenulispora pinistramenti]MBS2536181.1 PAS domain-containing sensor histidine kinase [Catenulispora pinistramenti]MBS2552486.1 PAS domain-containing sensor histidine kinase [Catenulispora pinistramenti]